MNFVFRKVPLLSHPYRGMPMSYNKFRVVNYGATKQQKFCYSLSAHLCIYTTYTTLSNNNNTLLFCNFVSLRETRSLSASHLNTQKK